MEPPVEFDAAVALSSTLLLLSKDVVGYETFQWWWHRASFEKEGSQQRWATSFECQRPEESPSSGGRPQGASNTPAKHPVDG